MGGVGVCLFACYTVLPFEFLSFAFHYKSLQMLVQNLVKFLRSILVVCELNRNCFIILKINGNLVRYKFNFCSEPNDGVAC